MYDILTIGEILVEILTEKTGQVFYRPGTLLSPYPSGAPATFIDQAARISAKCAIIAKVGAGRFRPAEPEPPAGRRRGHRPHPQNRRKQHRRGFCDLL